MDALILLILGVAVGIFSAFFGVGGGVLMVPILMALYPQMPIAFSVTCSLAVITVNSLLNVYNFYKNGKRIDAQFIKFIGLPSLIGISSAAYLVESLDTQTFKKVFAVGLLVLVLSFFFKRRLVEKTPAHPKTDYQFLPQQKWIVMSTGLIAGIIAGLTGLGGGVVLVPMFISILRIPINQVSMYSNATMGFTTIAGLTSYVILGLGIQFVVAPPYAPFQWGYLNLAITGIILFGSLFGSPIGVRLEQSASDTFKKYAFAFVLSLLALRLFLT